MDVSEEDLTRGTPTERILAAAVLVAFGGGSWLVWHFDPTKAGFFPVCPLYTLTGLACPGCGLTRGFHALFHGDLTTALHFNALIPLFALIFAFIVIVLTRIALGGKSLPRWLYSPKPLSFFFVLLIVFGVLRNLPFYPFTFLYP